MLSRLSFTSALVFAVPIVLVLIAVIVLTRPSRSTPAAPASDAALRPTPAVSSSTTVLQPTSAAQDVAPAAANQPEPTAALVPRPSGPIAPDFDGGGAWINSAPLKLGDLTGQGKIVLVDFWTYGCYNCTNTLPYMKQWWEKYKDQGLVIVGVHTPEFQSEHVLENVQAAVQREGIGWPVVQDNDYAIWRAYGNHYWPHFYLVDERGQIIYDHIGEGAYDETDRQIAAALAARGQ